MAIIGVAATLGEERRCLKALKKLDATSIQNAVKPIEISGVAKLSLDRVELALQRLIIREKVEKTGDNKYYAKCKDKKHC